MSGTAVSAALPRGRVRVSPRHAAKDTVVIMRRNLLRISREHPDRRRRRADRKAGATG